MVVSFLFSKIKHFLLFFVNIFRRALCCFRRRRRNSFDAVPLTHVGVISNNELDEKWVWEEKFENAEPKTIQDHIELYRKKKQDAVKKSDISVEEQADLFQDMTPRITRQTKVFINTNSEVNRTNRLNVVEDDDTIPVETGELREWEENGGWEGETLDWDAQEALRAKKRQDRERKLWEQHQKRQEKTKSLGARVST